MIPLRPVYALGMFLWALAPSDGLGQEVVVRGMVVEAGSDRPISTAAVYLFAGSRAIAAILSDESGRFHFTAPSAGDHSLQVDRIGFASERSEVFLVPPDGVTDLIMRVRVRPIELDPLSVSASKVCDLGDSLEPGLLTVWTETRKALNSTMVGARTGGRRFRVELSERELDRDMDVESERVDTIVTDADHGFNFAPLEELQLHGWGRIEDGVMTRFYGPSPEALLSPWFGANHCLSLADDRPGWLGLAFESIDGAMTIGIDGVFWIDPNTWQLRSIEFRFTGDRDLERAGEQGGTIELAVDPGLGWYVQNWRLRSPILRRGRLARVGHIGVVRQRRYDVTGYLERQGRVIGIAN